MSIRRLHHTQVMIPAEREAEARAFYCGLLGLTEVPKPAVLAARGGFWLAVGDAQLHVGLEARWRELAGTRQHVAYEVENLDGWRARLESAGVPIYDGEQLPGLRRFELRDPFGNRIELLEPGR